MFKKLHYKVRGLPTPLAGLALGIASLGWCLENALPLAGWGQTTGAVIGRHDRLSGASLHGAP